MTTNDDIKKSSAEIVQEARLSLRLNDKQLRGNISTKRPETPIGVRYFVANSRGPSAESVELHKKQINQRPSISWNPEKVNQNVLDKRRPVASKRLKPLLSLKSQNLAEPDSDERSLGINKPPDSARSCDSLSLSVSNNGRGESGYGSRPSSSASAYSELDLSIFSKELRSCLEQLSPFVREVSNIPEAEVVEVVSELHLILSSKALLGNRKWRGRTPVLKALFGALNAKQPLAALKIATLCLYLQVTGKNLTSLLIFLRDLCMYLETNGASYFSMEQLVEPESEFIKELLKLCNFFTLAKDAEKIICILETFNCTSSESSGVSRRQLVDLGIIEIIHEWWFQLHAMQRIQPYAQGGCSISPEEFLQHSAILIRNLLQLGRKPRIQLLELHFAPLLAEFLWRFRDEKEIVIQFFRILSVVSLNENFCECLLTANPDILHSFSVLLRQYYSEEDIAVRLLFVAGNFLSINQKAQWHLHLQENFYSAVFLTFRYYLEEFRLELAMQKSETEDKTERSDDTSIQSSNKNECTICEDILVKLVRLFGNITVHSGVGQVVCTNEELLNYLLMVLDMCSLPENEELVLNTLTTLHNLSYYKIDGNAIEHHQIKFVEAVYPCMMNNSLRVVIEACNVLGNLSRYLWVQQWLLERKVHVMMISLLESSSSELLSSACGILINLTLTKEGCSQICMANTDMETRLMDNLLFTNAGTNWTVCILACKLFWNMTAFDSLTFEVSQKLIEWLLKNTDDSALVSDKILPEDLKLQIKNLWEDEFCPLATDLLAHLSDFKNEQRKEETIH